MKNLFLLSSSRLSAARILKATFVLLLGLTLGIAFWVASMPVTQAQEMSPAKMLASELPAGKTMASASKQDILGALCSAVKKFRDAAPQIVRVVVEEHPKWSKDVLRTAYRCLGTDDCQMLGRVLHAVISGNEGDASNLTQLAIELAPNCADVLPGQGNGPGRGGESGEGNFGNPPGNANPPPGSVGGGGGQGNIVAVCHNGTTIFLSPESAQDDLRNNPGDYLGPCVVTQSTNN